MASRYSGERRAFVLVQRPVTTLAALAAVADPLAAAAAEEALVFLRGLGKRRTAARAAMAAGTAYGLPENRATTEPAGRVLAGNRAAAFGGG